MRLLFSAINCTLDTSNGAAISIRTLLKHFARHGVEAQSLSASVYDRPGDAGEEANLIATGARPVEEPGLTQTLWLKVDEGVRHYIEFMPAMTQQAVNSNLEQVLYNRALWLLDNFKPDVLMLYGARRYERSLLRKARERGIATVFYLVNPNYKNSENFQHVDMIFTDTEATRQLFAERFGFDCKVIGKFIDKPTVPPSAPKPQYVTLINPSAEKGVTLFLRIVELATKVLPEAKFLVVESRGRLATAEARTGLQISNQPNVRRIGLQTDMGPVFASTKILLVPSLWHDSGPRVSVEALSMGIPTVVSNRGGIAELVGDAGIVIDVPEPLVKEYWLVPPVSEAIPWVEVLRQLLTDPEVYEHYHQAALNRWREHDPDLRMPGIIADLERLVAGLSAQRAAAS